MPEKPKRLTELKVSIRTRRKILFEGSVFSITSKNSLGEFSILPQHANFISLVNDSLVLNKDTPNEREFEIERGLITVEAGNALIYVGI